MLYLNGKNSTLAPGLFVTMILVMESSRNSPMEEPVYSSEDSHIMLNAAVDVVQKAEKEEPYSFPKDGDQALDAACEALSDALQNAIKADVMHDTTEVQQALNNLQQVYNEAARSNTVSMRYIDIEPPRTPY